MECLVLNKHQKEMNEKCAVGVTHFQLVIHLQTPNLTFVSSCHYDIQLNVRDKNKIKKTVTFMHKLNVKCFQFWIGDEVSVSGERLTGVHNIYINYIYIKWLQLYTLSRASVCCVLQTYNQCPCRTGFWGGVPNGLCIWLSLYSVLLSSSSSSGPNERLPLFLQVQDGLQGGCSQTLP